MKSPKKLIELFADARVKVALTSLVVALLVYVGADERTKEVAIALIGFLGVIAAVVLGGGYWVDGKRVEGTVPDGHRSINDVPANLVELIALIAEQRRAGEAPPPPPEAVITVPPGAVVTVTPPPAEPEPPSASGQNEAAKAFAKAREGGGAFQTSKLIGLMLFALLLIGGCAVSEPYKRAVNKVGPGLAQAAQDYVDHDKTLVDAAVAERRAEAQRLRDVTAGTFPVVSAVRPAWDEVRGWYQPYVERDANLNELERRLRLTVIREFDGLLSDEARRPLGSPAGSPAPPPPPQPVAPVAPAPVRPIVIPDPTTTVEDIPNGSATPVGY